MKIWGGRFTKETDAQANSFHSSISFDNKLYKPDILGSIAHAEMLGKQGIIPADDARKIAVELGNILSDIDSGLIEFDEDAEDIHMNVEKILTERIGDAGKRLHTGRSRNDQVALDLRMYLKDGIRGVQGLLLRVARLLVKTAKNHTQTVMPGYTHMQKAQPITLAHHQMAYFEMFKRDFDRLDDCFRRTDVMPLGSGALAATNYPIDREFVRERLGFAHITANSLDAVSDRDFCAEFLSAASIIMMHLSRFCEELILWASDEFRFVELDDAFSTGSSIMPQKKNPDFAELIRGKTGRVYGDLTGILTIMKSLPLAYNKDMQEDKEAVFDGLDTLSACLGVFAQMYAALRFNAANMRRGAARGFTNATAAADYLTKKGVPFRDAHEIIGRLVLYAINADKPLDDLSLDEFRSISPAFDGDVFEKISLQSCVNAGSTPGGPSEAAVANALGAAEEWLSANTLY